MRRRLLAFLCEVPVVWSFVYLALGRILELIEVQVLRRQVTRPRVDWADRAVLAGVAPAVATAELEQVVRPARDAAALASRPGPTSLTSWVRKCVSRRLEAIREQTGD